MHDLSAALERLIPDTTNSANVGVDLRSSKPDGDGVTYEPVPIPESPPVPRLRPEMLPDPLREWIIDIGQRRGCPPEYPALAALCGAGGIIGTKIGIRPKKNDTFFVFPNLYGLAVGESGSQKSDGIRDGLQFVEEIQDEAWADYERRLPAIQSEQSDREAELHACDAALKAYHGGSQRKKDSGRVVDREVTKARIAELKAVKNPTPERMLIEDATIEKIGELLNENPRGVIAYHDEISGLLDTFQSKDRKQDRPFYLKGWNGTGSHAVDRIGRGSMRIKNMCLSLIGGIQPAKIAPCVEEVRSGKNDDGLLQRFASVSPDPLREYVYVDEPPRGISEARSVFKRLNAFTPEAYEVPRLTQDAGGHAFLQFDGDAQAFFQEWITLLEKQRRGFDTFDTSLPSSHLSKFRGLMPKLALIFQLIDLVSHADNELAISLKNARLAADWCDFFKAHAVRLYANHVSSQFSGAKRILSALESGEIPARFTARDVYNHHWSGVDKPENTVPALNTLIEYGWIESVQIQTGGRPTTVYLFENPKPVAEVSKVSKGTEMDHPDEIAERSAIMTEAKS